MNENYLSNLKAAAERTSECGLLEELEEVMVEIISEEGPHEELGMHALGYMEFMLSEIGADASYLAINCFNVNANAYRHFWEKRVPVLLTVGDLLVDGKPRFGTTPDSIASEVKAPDLTKVFSAHSWFTLPGGVVVDATLRSALSTQAARRRPRANLSSLLTLGNTPGKGRRASSQNGKCQVRDLDRGSHLVEWIPMMVGIGVVNAVSFPEAL